ncbi:MAG TPA: undecaprenyl-diphosphate phosphatase [Polyangiaceae bacterium]|nr:undecaprenyl-diphosphate phosphatase [Polyangiaceae bacterium]
MGLLIAVLLGVVEGLTEYLPVSSTGHLLLVEAWLERSLGHGSEGGFAFDVVIQFGAILAVVVYYRRLLAVRVAGLVQRDPAAVRLWLSLALAFLPTAVAGLLARKIIKTYFSGPLTVAAALVAGGVLMIGVEWWQRRRAASAGGAPPARSLEEVTPRQAFFIGVGQCFALWPGMSRSMSTIVSGQLVGLSTAAAAEFSFLLALPTLGAATFLEAFASWDKLLDSFEGALALLTGLVVSFVVALAVIAAFLRYLTRYGLTPFGYYRIVLGLAVAWALRP